MTTLTVELKKCNLCGGGFEELPESKQCRKCGSLKTRLYRHFSRNAEEERKQWNNLSRSQRQMFYSKWHGELRMDLKAAISEIIVESESKHATSKKEYKWLDDFQLRERYKGREEQIDNIKKNAETMHCTVRDVALWADPEYTSSEVASKDSTLKRELSKCTVSSYAKKAKVDPAPKAKPQPAPKTGEGKLSLQQLQTLANDKAKLVELLQNVRLTNHKANLPELVEEIKKRDREPLKETELKLTSMIATVHNSIESQMANYKYLRKEIRATQVEAKFNHKKLKECVADAENQVSPEVTATIQEQMEAVEWPLIEWGVLAAEEAARGAGLPDSC